MYSLFFPLHLHFCYQPFLQAGASPCHLYSFLFECTFT
uniref:Uncharacterized protein n=1 Tax=Arundo donax TaxID=35708 RepID=A0A0A8YIR9_ARUDO